MTPRTDPTQNTTTVNPDRPATIGTEAVAQILERAAGSETEEHHRLGDLLLARIQRLTTSQAAKVLGVLVGSNYDAVVAAIERVEREDAAVVVPVVHEQEQTDRG